MTRITRWLAGLFVCATLTSQGVAAPAPYPNPGVEAPASTFTAGIDGVLVGYYTGFAGGFTNLAGALIDGVVSAIGMNNQTTPYGTRFEFGPVSAGDVLVFFIDVIDTSERFFSDPAMNSDRVNHAFTSFYAGDAQVPSGFNILFEDLLNGGDFNYSDHGWVIGIEQRAAVPVAPIMPLVLVALALLAHQRRRTG